VRGEPNKESKKTSEFFFDGEEKRKPFTLHCKRRTAVTTAALLNTRGGCIVDEDDDAVTD